MTVFDMIFCLCIILQSPSDYAFLLVELAADIFLQMPLQSQIVIIPGFDASGFAHNPIIFQLVRLDLKYIISDVV
jgi:hypothetical protein